MTVPLVFLIFTERCGTRGCQGGCSDMVFVRASVGRRQTRQFHPFTLSLWLGIITESSNILASRQCSVITSFAICILVTTSNPDTLLIERVISRSISIVGCNRLDATRSSRQEINHDGLCILSIDRQCRAHTSLSNMDHMGTHD